MNANKGNPTYPCPNCQSREPKAVMDGLNVGRTAGTKYYVCENCGHADGKAMRDQQAQEYRDHGPGGDSIPAF